MTFFAGRKLCILQSKFVQPRYQSQQKYRRKNVTPYGRLQLTKERFAYFAARGKVSATPARGVRGPKAVKTPSVKDAEQVGKETSQYNSECEIRNCGEHFGRPKVSCRQISKVFCLPLLGGVIKVMSHGEQNNNKIEHRRSNPDGDFVCA